MFLTAACSQVWPHEAGHCRAGDRDRQAVIPRADDSHPHCHRAAQVPRRLRTACARSDVAVVVTINFGLSLVFPRLCRRLLERVGVPPIACTKGRDMRGCSVCGAPCVSPVLCWMLKLQPWTQACPGFDTHGKKRGMPLISFEATAPLAHQMLHYILQKHFAASIFRELLKCVWFPL